MKKITKSARLTIDALKAAEAVEIEKIMIMAAVGNITAGARNLMRAAAAVVVVVTCAAVARVATSGICVTSAVIMIDINIAIGSEMIREILEEIVWVETVVVETVAAVGTALMAAAVIRATNVINHEVTSKFPTNNNHRGGAISITMIFNNRANNNNNSNINSLSHGAAEIDTKEGKRIRKSGECPIVKSPIIVNAYIDLNLECLSQIRNATRYIYLTSSDSDPGYERMRVKSYLNTGNFV